MITLNNVTTDQIQRATKRAKDARLFVRPTSIFRMYKVENRENHKTYTAQFFVRDGVKYGSCDCPATVFCKHLLVAAGLHLHVAKQKLLS